MNLTMPWSITCVCCDSEIDVEVRITSFTYGRAAVLYPNDLASPEEPAEVEFTVHRYDDGKEIDAERAMSKDEYDRLIDAAIEFAAEDIRDTKQMAAEARWEARMGK